MTDDTIQEAFEEAYPRVWKAVESTFHDFQNEGHSNLGFNDEVRKAFDQRQVSLDDTWDCIESRLRRCRDPLRFIHTGRALGTINSAVRRGLKPLIKVLVPNKNIQDLIMLVYQHRDTGEIREVPDYRAAADVESSTWRPVVECRFYQYSFPSPYAAYLIPPGLKINERVWIADLIEDLCGSSLRERIPCCEATWNGKGFDIDYDPNRDHWSVVG